MISNRISIVIAISLLVGSVCIPVAASWPASVYAPYVDVSLYPPYFINLTDMKTATGVKYYTLCFVNGDEKHGNEPAWGAQGSMFPISEQSIYGEAKSIRAAGGDVIISFGGVDGGARGYELAMLHTDVAVLQSKYQEVIDLYNATWVDFDIEDRALQDTASIDRRSKAILGLQNANPGLKVALCLPVTPEGLDAFGLGVITNAIENGVTVDCVNLMLMDYGPYYTKTGAPMADLGIWAAYNVSEQLQVRYPAKTEAQIWGMIGYTPMIGQNDCVPEVFWEADAFQVLAFAQGKSCPLMGIWSANRDNGDGGRNTAASPIYSGIVQEKYNFSKIFVQIE